MYLRTQTGGGGVPHPSTSRSGDQVLPERSFPYGPLTASVLAIALTLSTPVTADAGTHLDLSGVPSHPVSSVGDHLSDHRHDVRGEAHEVPLQTGHIVR
jgi:hypothetical protein